MNNAQPSSPVTFDVEHIPVVDDPREWSRMQKVRANLKFQGDEHLFCTRRTSSA